MKIKNVVNVQKKNMKKPNTIYNIQYMKKNIRLNDNK